MELERLSYSSLALFAKCGLQFQRVKIEQAVEPSGNMETARGKLIHKWIEDVAQLRIDHGEWPSIDDANSILEHYWHEGYDDDGFNPLNDTEWTDEFLHRSYNDSFKLVPILYDKVFSTIVPQSVENHLEVALPQPGKTIKTLHGIIDMFHEPDGIIDWKTRGSAMNEQWIDTDLQATVYAALSGYQKTRISFVQLIFPKRAKPNVRVVTTERDVRHVDWLLEDLIPSVIRAIESEMYTPNPGWQCHFCPVPCGVLPDVGTASH